MTGPVNNTLATYRSNIASLLDEIDARDQALAQSRREIAELKSAALIQRPPAQLRQPSRQISRNSATAGKRAAVVCWDLAHNPAGRAVVIYDLLAKNWDVDLVGPVWDRYGTDVWAPIARSGRSILSFKCSRFEDFYPKALGFAAVQRYDLVVIVKPRLPGILLGALLHKSNTCPVVLDVDDFELSFFKDETAASLDDFIGHGPQALELPYEELPTRVCEGLISGFPSKTVSNVALRARYGGIIVRHARNEQLFDPDRFDRCASRAKMGIAKDDFAIMFVGTPRPHKGIFEVAQALHDIPDKRFVFHIVGQVTDASVRAKLDNFVSARIVYHPNCDLDELPEKLSAADALALLQDVDHPISQFQIPAKVSDGASFGHPILASNVPPLRDLFESGILIEPNRDGGIRKDLQALMTSRESGTSAARRKATRAAFLAELGEDVNALRLSFAVSEAQSNPTLPEEVSRLLVHAQSAYSMLRLNSSAMPSPHISTEHKPDVVMFWKQNDSNLFGRRSDMMMTHLQRSGVIGRVLQLDAPQPAQIMRKLILGEHASAQSTDLLTQRNLIDDQFGLRDTDTFFRRTFLWADKHNQSPLLTDLGTGQDEVADYVKAQMRELNFDPQNTIAWVCPVVFDFPAISDAVPFRTRIGDLIDDQRTFPMQETFREKVVKSYEDTLPLIDAVLTNCAPMVEAFAGLRDDIQVVPNGAEVIDDPASVTPHADIVALGGRVVGYVGNLRDRFDWALLAETANRMPDTHFVIVGGGARPEDTEIVSVLSNVTLFGPVSYENVKHCIRAFDVAIMPHERSDQTQRMNPLKIYNYLALHKPVVTTYVDNIDRELTPFIRFADGPEEFADAISAAFRDPLTQEPGFDDAVRAISWERRVEQVTQALGAHIQ